MTHGDSRSREYRAWKKMHDRCRNPNNPRFDDYGAKGIAVCERWADYSNFLADMGRRPSQRHSLDRRDNDLGYTPGNCRWATPHEQMTNRTVTRFVQFEGVDIPLATLAQRFAIPANTLRFRVLKGWPIQEALMTPVRAKAPHRH
jgi:hypothetical protein